MSQKDLCEMYPEYVDGYEPPKVGLSGSNALLYPEFMRGMCNAPWDDDKCGQCGGTGLKPVICCNGSECGCRGMPVDFTPCDCGTEPPTDEQIRSWV